MLFEGQSLAPGAKGSRSIVWNEKLPTPNVVFGAQPKVQSRWESNSASHFPQHSIADPGHWWMTLRNGSSPRQQAWSWICWISRSTSGINSTWDHVCWGRGARPGARHHCFQTLEFSAPIVQQRRKASKKISRVSARLRPEPIFKRSRPVLILQFPFQKVRTGAKCSWRKPPRADWSAGCSQYGCLLLCAKVRCAFVDLWTSTPVAAAYLWNAFSISWGEMRCVFKGEKMRDNVKRFQHDWPYVIDQESVTWTGNGEWWNVHRILK